MNEIKNHKSKYTILGGDFNCEFNSYNNKQTSCSKWIKNKLKENNLTKIDQKEQILTHNYEPIIHDKRVIDSIFYSESLIPIKSSYKEQKQQYNNNSISPVYEKNNNVYYSDILDGSDHPWIIIEFLKNKSNLII